MPVPKVSALERVHCKSITVVLAVFSFHNKFISIFQNALLPVHERQENQTEKTNTGPFDRQHLLEHLEEQAKSMKERTDYVPYKKETRGKVWRPKEQPGRKEPAPLLPDDLSEVLDNATDEEMMELAGKCCLFLLT